ncbi:MAG: hypothetical protein WC804_00210 [Sphingomonas sp.]|uniref:hypothetical protein n=1 Tax=Sphingomonas sp. TaxID=28214 RepID=UPI003564402F
MHVLFYLPVVTPWWFDNIVAPLIRAAASDARVSVLVPPLWRGTGIGPEQLGGCSDLDTVDWYILDGDDHPGLRVSAADEQELLALVNAIDADITLCRSADLDSAARFPGMVRFIMEGGAPPFATAPTLVWLSETLFDHALMPTLDPAIRTRLDAAFRPEWDTARAGFAHADRDAFLAAAGLPCDKRLIALPLEYEHPEMFFGQHNVFADNIALVHQLADQLDEDSVLAVTNHPLNEMHCDNDALLAAIAAHGGKVRLVRATGAPGDATMQLARHCDGMVVGNSKSFSGCAFFGTPMLRLSRFRTGGWMHAYDAFAPFAAALRNGTARRADPADALSWFALHLLDRTFDPADADLSAAAIAARITRPIDPLRWTARHDVRAAA